MGRIHSVADGFTENISDSIDMLAVMNGVLEGQRSTVLNVQVSVVDQLLGARQIEKNTFLGKLNRRQVQLIECGKDRALVFSYLNKIVQQLVDKNWLRDY